MSEQTNAASCVVIVSFLREPFRDQLLFLDTIARHKESEFEDNGLLNCFKDGIHMTCYAGLLLDIKS